MRKYTSPYARPPKKASKALLGGFLATLGRAGMAGAQAAASRGGGGGGGGEGGGCTPCAAQARLDAAKKVASGS